MRAGERCCCWGHCRRHRTGLVGAPPTTHDSGGLVGLAIILSLVDVYAARRAGLAGWIGTPEMSWQVWWAIGTAVAAGFAAALGLAVAQRTTRFAVAALLPVTPELLALRIADTEWAGPWPLPCWRR